MRLAVSLAFASAGCAIATFVLVFFSEDKSLTSSSFILASALFIFACVLGAAFILVALAFASEDEVDGIVMGDGYPKSTQKTSVKSDERSSSTYKFGSEALDQRAYGRIPDKDALFMHLLEYHAISKSQRRTSFRIGTIAMVAGLIALLSGILLLYLGRTAQNVAAVVAVGGVLSEFIGA